MTPARRLVTRFYSALTACLMLLRAASKRLQEFARAALLPRRVVRRVQLV
jgi:hypothetical protein